MEKVINKALRININNHYTVTFIFKSVNVFRKVITQFNDPSIKFLLFTIKLIKFNADFICFTVIMRVNSFAPSVKDI